MQLLTLISLYISVGLFTSCSNTSSGLAKEQIPEPMIRQSEPQNVLQGGVAAFERRIAANVDRNRMSAGYSPMEFHPGIAKLARNHSHYLSKKHNKTGKRGLNHDGVKGRFNKLILNYSMNKVAENIIVTSGNFNDNAGEISKVWMNSPKHKKNILKKWNYTGVGVSVAADGAIYATQIFGLKIDNTL